jgi:hypothetical protein
VGGSRGGGSDMILDRCRAFDLFASVDAHLWYDYAVAAQRRCTQDLWLQRQRTYAVYSTA